MNKFINIIKCKMIKENISEKRLSDMIGCSQSLLNRWLNEEEEIPVIISNNIKKVLEIYDDEKKVSLEELNIKYNKLTRENKEKVLEYINYLQYNQKNLKLSKKNNF